MKEIDCEDVVQALAQLTRIALELAAHGRGCRVSVDGAKNLLSFAVNFLEVRLPSGSKGICNLFLRSGVQMVGEKNVGLPFQRDNLRLDPFEILLGLWSVRQDVSGVFHADRADLEEATPGAHANVRGLGGELIDEKEPFGRAVAPGSSGLDRYAFLKCMNYMHSIVVIYYTHRQETIGNGKSRTSGPGAVRWGAIIREIRFPLRRVRRGS